VVVVCAVAAAGAAGAATSPKALRAAILKAASAKHSVHYVVGSRPGSRIKMVSDVAANRGIQRVTFSKSGRTGHATTVVVKSTAYVRGDAFALHAYMRLPASFAARYAGKWIAIPHTSPLYRPEAIDVTFGIFHQ